MEGVPRKESKRHAKRIFEALDEDGQLYSFLVLLSITASLHSAGNGSLDEDEFVKGCLTDPDFSRVIQHSIEKLKVQAD